MSSFGESGLPVFQAGHCDWQRPHSVQVARSRSCFHEKSSIRPAPNTTSSSSPDVLHRQVRGRGERAEGPGAPGGGDVDRRQEDVEVLRVGDEDEEAGDDRDVGEEGHRLDDAVDPGAERLRAALASPCEAKAHQP